MSNAKIGLLWAIAFVVLESVQYVFFGGLFQRMNSFAFGALVFSIVIVLFIGWSLFSTPEQLRHALKHPRLLFAINLTATLAWIAFLGSVQLIEPAVAYTIGAGVMPLTAWVAHRMGVAEGEPMRNPVEALGNVVLLLAIAFLAVVTVMGWSGFVREPGMASVPVIASLGIVLAIADGVLFTWLLIYCQRLDRKGVTAGTVFGLRFPLYVLVAGTFAAAGIGGKPPEFTSELAGIVLLGLMLIVPPLYALQKAVASISTLTLSALTALGPLIIFLLQLIEGRVEYSTASLIGLVVYFLGALLASFGAVRAAID